HLDARPGCPGAVPGRGRPGATPGSEVLVMTAPATDHAGETATNPLRGVVAGIALVLIAVLVGVILQRSADPNTEVTPAADVSATGNTTTVEVTAEGMRFRPDHVEVPAGDRLVI